MSKGHLRPHPWFGRFFCRLTVPLVRSLAGSLDPRLCQRTCVRTTYMAVQEEDLSAGFLTDSATLAASVNASLTPRFFIAEHSVAPSVPNVPGKQHAKPLRTEIPQRLYPLGNLKSLFVFDHCPLGLLRLVVILLRALTQIALQCYEHKLDTRAVLCDF
jgi:hypothetical protein